MLSPNYSDDTEIIFVQINRNSLTYLQLESLGFQVAFLDQQLRLLPKKLYKTMSRGNNLKK